MIGRKTPKQPHPVRSSGRLRRRAQPWRCVAVGREVRPLVVKAGELP